MHSVAFGVNHNECSSSANVPGSKKIITGLEREPYLGCRKSREWLDLAMRVGFLRLSVTGLCDSGDGTALD